MIRIQDLEFLYGEGGFQLRIPSLEIASGETVAVIGPSGCGKTTFLNLISGISVPARGKVEVDGLDLGGMTDADRRSFRIRTIGFVFQDFELFEYLTVLDNVLQPFRIHRSLKLDRGVKKRARFLATGMGLGDKLGRPPDRLSQGERQRAAICRALLSDPRILLADEPTGNLDPASKNRILELLFECAERTGATLVTVTHDHGLLPGFDRVIDFATFQGPET